MINNNYMTLKMVPVGHKNKPSRRSHPSTQKRAITREDFQCSSQSVLTAMDKFVKSVNNMDSVVLVPSKLRDMDMDIDLVPMATTTSSPSSPSSPSSTPSLHSFYQMFQSVKQELLWGPTPAAMAMSSSASTMMFSPSSPPSASSSSSSSSFGLSGRSSPREPSVMTNSSISLETTSSRCSSTHDDDMESLLTSDSSTSTSSSEEEVNHLASAFRYHLQGLHAILAQLTESADYVATRYQEEVNP